MEHIEDEESSECNFLKRSAFNQYFAISQEMSTYEKDLFAKFLHEGTFVVNNVLKRNILKLKFMTLPEELKDDVVRNKDVPQSMSLARVQQQKPLASRTKQQLQQKAMRSSQGILGSLVPRKSLSTKSKFNIFSTAIQWMANRPVSDNPDLALAEKLMKASESVTSLRSTRTARNDFKISQAKCKIC